MSELFDDLRQGLQEAIDYEKGTGPAKVRTYTIEPVKKLSHYEIKMFQHFESDAENSVLSPWLISYW